MEGTHSPGRTTTSSPALQAQGMNWEVGLWRHILRGHSSTLPPAKGCHGETTVLAGALGLVPLRVTGFLWYPTAFLPLIWPGSLLSAQM